MNGAMAGLDWAIMVAVLFGVVGIGLFARRYMHSVVDFLAAGRSAGRYLITISYGVANIGAITVLAFFEQNYEAGATLMWWEALLQVALLFAMLSGWVVYRFRQTRCLTLAEFFERRYGRGFRVFSGAMAFVAGVLNFAIFPLVGSKFFVFFCGLPPHMQVLGASIPTHVPVMIFLLSIALWFVFSGGQVGVIATDFAQGVFANVVFVVVSVFLLVLVGWGEISSVLAVSEPGQSRINPFDTASLQHFGILFFVISLIEVLYGQMSWQGEQAYFSSARSAHEARMGGVLRLWFLQIRLVFFLVVPIVAYTILNSTQWLSVQQQADAALSTLTDPQDVERFRVPVVLSLVLPVGLKGMMAAMMLAAFISTHNTYLHSWGSIFTQDVLLPVLNWRGYQPGRRTHLWMLRSAVLLVAVIAFIYSAFLYNPTEPIMLYLAITGAIFLGWSGTVIIGGLYWPRGTKRAAWTTAILGSLFTLTSFVVQKMNDAFLQTDQAFFGWLSGPRARAAADVLAQRMPDGKEILGLTMLLCVSSYIVVSLLDRKKFDLHTLLHRDETPVVHKSASWFRRLLGFTTEHTRLDRLTAFLTVGLVVFWFLVFVIGTLWALLHLASGGTQEDMVGAWLTFWHWRLWMMILAAALATVALGIGGAKDLRRLFAMQHVAKRDDHDDGIVR